MKPIKLIVPTYRILMTHLILRKLSVLRSSMNSCSRLCCANVSLLKASTFLRRGRDYSVANRLHLSPLCPENDTNCMKDCKIQLMDDETWLVSSGLAHDWRGSDFKVKPLTLAQEMDDDDDDDAVVNSVAPNKENPDFDEIEDMRMRGRLFYKIDRDSKQYQEYSFDFHRRKSPTNKKGQEKNKKDHEKKNEENPKKKLDSKVEKASKKNEKRNNKKMEEYKPELSLKGFKDEYSISQPHNVEKKQRTLTFNQKTAAYHEPFCLDIYISNSSVRASIIHRATSNVVAVSHSISKDMKFDLSSTKNRNACAAVGEVLAQRALADDIHNVIYTPRKGEKLEGKLQVVLKSVIDGGVNVKVKLKQKKIRKAGGYPPRIR